MSKQLKKYFKDIADKLRNNGLTVGGEVALPLNASWRYIAYGAGKFVIIASDSNKAAYSSDGATWEEVNLPSEADWKSVAYGDGKFVAVAYNSNKAAYSEDGINWLETTMPSSTYWYSVTYGAGKFVAVAAVSANEIAYSEDGINWASTTDPALSYSYCVTYGGDKFVAVSATATAIYSFDGINWTATSMPSDITWISVTYGSGEFLAVSGYSRKKVAHSKDGINWSETILPTIYASSVTYGEDKFIVVSAGEIIYSCDGINWITSIVPAASWRSATYGAGKFVVISYNKAAYSCDGINWDDKIKADDFPKRILELADMRKKKPGPIPVPSNNDLVMHFNGTISDATGNTAFTEVPAYISVTSDKSKFGNGSLRCYSTSGNQITGLRTTKKYDVGAKDFTIDFWFYYDNPPMYSTHPGYYTVIEFFGDNKDDGCAIYETHNSCKAIIGDISSLGYDYTSPAESGLPAGQWNHIALVRHNGVARLYFNGQQYHNNNSTQYGGYSSTHWPQDGNLPFSDDLGEVGIEISQQMASTVRPDFYIDELRVKIGEAVWTSDFTPPTAPYN